MDSESYKTCTKCGGDKPLGCFSKDKNRRDGLSPWCKQCKSTTDKAYQRKHKVAIAAKKKQYALKNKEQIAKYKSEYQQRNKDKIAEYKKQYQDKHREDIAKKKKVHYLANREYCLEKSSQYRQAHKEEMKGYLSDYYKRNKTQLSIGNAERYQKNKQKYAARNKKYYYEHLEQARARSKKYSEENKEKITAIRKAYSNTENGRSVRKAAQSKYKALRRNAKTVERVDVEGILKRDGYICQQCRRKTRPDYHVNHPLYPHADHIVPLSKGGEHSKRNMQCLCRLCNITKNNIGVGDQLRMFG